MSRRWTGSAGASPCPTGIWQDEGPDALVWLLQYYDPLVSFYKEASARGDAIIQFLD